MSKKNKTEQALPRKPGYADDSGCYGCQYHDPSGRAGTCNYCYITGHMRGSSVEECTRKTIGPRLYMPRELMMDGTNIPLTREAIEAQRSAKRPEPKTKPWEQPEARWSKFDRAKAWELYQAGKNDLEIATALDVSRQTIRNWRKEHLLPPRQGRGSVKKSGAE